MNKFAATLLATFLTASVSYGQASIFVSINSGFDLDGNPVFDASLEVSDFNGNVPFETISLESPSGGTSGGLVLVDPTTSFSAITDSLVGSWQAFSTEPGSTPTPFVSFDILPFSLSDFAVPSVITSPSEGDTVNGPFSVIADHVADNRDGSISRGIAASQSLPGIFTSVPFQLASSDVNSFEYTISPSSEFDASTFDSEIFIQTEITRSNRDFVPVTSGDWMLRQFDLRAVSPITTVNFSPIPEPGSFLLLASGTLVCGLLRRRTS